MRFAERGDVIAPTWRARLRRCSARPGEEMVVRATKETRAGFLVLAEDRAGASEWLFWRDVNLVRRRAG